MIGEQVLAGRAFEAGDAGSAVVILDEYFVKRHLDGVDPLATSVGVPVGPDEYQPARIVGVVPTTKHLRLEEDAAMGTVYRFVADPAAPVVLPSYVLLWLDAGLGGIRSRLTELAGAHGLRLGKVDLIGEWMRASLRRREPLMRLLGGFALASLVLCCTGLFALVQFAVRSRRGEFGLKLALGATGTNRALARGAGRGAAQRAAGTGPGRARRTGGGPPAGLAAVSGLAVRPADAVRGRGLPGGCGALAAWWPARRAARVAPAEVLRQE